MEDSVNMADSAKKERTVSGPFRGQTVDLWRFLLPVPAVLRPLRGMVLRHFI